VSSSCGRDADAHPGPDGTTSLLELSAVARAAARSIAFVHMHMRTEHRRLIEDSICWDVVNWSKCLTYWEQHGSLREGADALEVGAGHNGGVTLWLASKGARVVCSGLEQPSAASRAIHERYDLSSWVEYQHLDVLDMDYDESFDVVLFKSVLGDIGRNQHFEQSIRAVAAMHRALKPGGELWFAENCAATRLHQYLRDRYSWGKQGQGWRYVSLREVDALMAPFESCSHATVGFVGLLGRTERQRRALGCLDTLIFDRLVPAAARYIVMGVARKARARSRGQHPGALACAD
jgi:2-polyprenyl-3-methyl-5-hydroxy-6-metoxy-1,4-benzoquinol methylase